MPDDVKQMAHHVLGHRLIVRPESRLRKKTAAGVLEEILNRVPVPQMPRQPPSPDEMDSRHARAAGAGFGSPA